MKLARIFSLLTGAVVACQFSVAFAETPIAPETGAATVVAGENDPGASNARATAPRLTPPSNGAFIRTASAVENADIKTITLHLPAGTQAETLKAVLNGKDVSSNFSVADCGEPDGVCATGTLSTSDGLRVGKNVLYTIATKSDGTLASARLRFNFGSSPVRAASSMSLSARNQAATGVGNNIADTNFTPPTVTFNTLTPGGWQGNTPWIQIGNETLPDSSVSACTSDIYLVIVLDRFTLLPVPGMTQCEADATAVNEYLKTITSDEISIVGTNFQHNADAALDTSAIGGSPYREIPQTSPIYPRGYMAIGAGGAAPGSAYENYYSDAIGSVLPFATGTMVEDQYGHYNFQSSLAVEYLVTPNDPANNNQSTVTIYNVQSLSPYSQFSYPNKVVYFSPANQTNGYWLLTLQRDNLGFDPNWIFTANGSKQETDITSCGTFYPTGSSDGATEVTAYVQLSAALNALKPNQLAFLVSVGVPAHAKSAWDLVSHQYHGTWAYEGNFGNALENLGGVPISTLDLYKPGSAYSLVTCAACGNPMTGNSALSTTAYTQQGQTGTIHGVLQRNLNGYYWPTRASQETAGSSAVSDFTLDSIGSRQPVKWPELSGTLLAGASTVAGQVAAYQYASYQLVTQYYIKGAQGDFLDDIHYYFTGSLNTFLNYHTFDPADLQFPGQSGTCYTWTDPVTNTALPCFTQQDLRAVAQQLSTEIVDLDNVLVFMVTGSTNMKDVVATGNGSAALALIGAAASIEASTIQPPATTPVKTNVSNILNLVSSVVNIGVTIATDGLVPPDMVDIVTRGGGIIGSVLGASSSITGGLTQGGGSPSQLPSEQYKFETTIGDLANNQLQQQITIGFDTELDSITSDWGKLSTLGPLITNSNYPEFYSPNQVAQNAAVSMLGQGSQRDFYIALLPAFYHIHYFPNWLGDPTLLVNPPDFGALTNGGTCQSWYAWFGPNNTVNMPPNVDRWVPTYHGHFNPWEGNYTPTTPVDHYIIAGAIHNPGKVGSNGQTIDFIDSQVASTMFTTAGLDIPLDEFVTRNGPMASVFLDTTVNGFDNFPAGQTASCYQGYADKQQVGTGPGNANATTTTLVVPPSSVLGESVTLQATVTTSSGPVSSGTVTFDDGTVQMGSGTVNSNGVATFSTSALALGTHSVAAYYVENGQYRASQSAVSTLTVYANSPQMTVTLSTRNLNVSYGSTSSAVALKMVSQSGLAGKVTLSCTGLPVGMACSFNPAQPAIAAGGTAASSLTISAAATQAAALPLSSGITGLLLLPVSVALLWRVRRNARAIQASLCILLLVLVSVGGLVGCGGGSNKAPLPSGSQTILVNATSGSFTMSVPLVLNIQ